MFQCSSASRKFLNLSAAEAFLTEVACFSALQRAENSSITAAGSSIWHRDRKVSVLFSEPKIPQCCAGPVCGRRGDRFSALQRAEKSSLFALRPRTRVRLSSFSALQRAENSSTGRYDRNWGVGVLVSVLFSEPKIPQSPGCCRRLTARSGFSALQRAENSSIPTLAPASIHIPDCDDHASSFLSLPGASP